MRSEYNVRAAKVATPLTVTLFTEGGLQFSFRPLAESPWGPATRYEGICNDQHGRQVHAVFVKYDNPTKNRFIGTLALRHQ